MGGRVEGRVSGLFGKAGWKYCHRTCACIAIELVLSLPRESIAHACVSGQ